MTAGSPHRVEHEAEEVVDDRGHRAAVDDPRGTDVPLVEHVLAHHRVALAPDLDVVAVRIARPAPEAVGVVRRENTVPGTGIEPGGSVAEDVLRLPSLGGAPGTGGSRGARAAGHARAPDGSSNCAAGTGSGGGRLRTRADARSSST